MGKFSDLPSDVMLDIFTRLPTESVLDCKSVSKRWRSVLQQQSFAQMHSGLLLGTLDSAASDDDSSKYRFICKMRDVSGKQLYHLEYDDEISAHRLKKLTMNLPLDLFIVIGSCNGLVCINGLPNYYTIDESTTASYVACICNPITRESITLPELDRSTYYHLVDCMCCGFGYVASKNEYKVVRLYTFNRYAYQREHQQKYDYKYAQIEVYTLGSGRGWRNAGKIHMNSGSLFGVQRGVFVDGFVYWDFGKGKIMAFDLADEVFVGYTELRNGELWMGVLGGYLCDKQYTSEHGKSSDIWLLKKKEDESFSWSKEFSLTNTGPYSTPIALMNNGAVLSYSDRKLQLYDLKSSSAKLLEKFGQTFCQAIPHVNSLVSLKAFGGEVMKTLDVGGSNRNSKKSRKRKNR